MLDRIDAAPQAQQAAARNAAVSAQAAGAYSGSRVVKMPSAAQLLQDIQEEIGFAQSEKMEEKDIEEYECEDAHQNLYAHLVEKIEEAYPQEDPTHKEKQESFAKRLLSRQGQSEEEIARHLGDLTEDKGEAFALLKEAHDNPPPGLDAATRAALKNTLEKFAEKEGTQILAGVNAAAEARRMSRETGIEASALQASYQNMVADYAGILPALAQITVKTSPDHFEDHARFIMQAAEKDLAAERSSRQPEKLRRILAEFQGLKIFNTLREWSSNAFALFSKKAEGEEEGFPFKKDELFTQSLQFLNRPEQFHDLIQQPIRNMSPESQVLFLQDMRNGVRLLPDYLFQNPDEEKARILFPVQTRIDRLVFEEEA